ncbi:MAG: DUF1566 domain-containing protein [Comamonadaceae bacterium]|nr:DUF1566 domain-containing protein [Comamonadaceae bacterium]
MAKRLITIITATLALLSTGQALAALLVNSNGTVTDTSTGLMWDKCSWGQANDSTCSGTASPHDWPAAFGVAATASGLNWKGYSDWRLPSIVELFSLVKPGGVPTIDTTAFPNTPSLVFWSASAYALNSSDAWLVNFNFGNFGFDSKLIAGQIRLVREGQYFGAFGLFPAGVSGATANSATLSATSAVAATGRWLVVPRNATPPSAAQVIASGASYAATTGTVSIAAAGTGGMTAKTPVTFTMNGLIAGTAYDLYVVAQDFNFQTTSNVVGPIQFSTLAISTSSIVIDPSTPTKLYAALDRSGVYASPDSGASWTTITTAGLTNLNVRALVIQNSNTLFAATYDGGVFKGTLSTGNWTWAACGTGLGAARLRTLTLDASGNLYAGGETSVFKGSSACTPGWTAINTGLPQ